MKFFEQLDGLGKERRGGRMRMGGIMTPFTVEHCDSYEACFRALESIIQVYPQI